MKQLGKNLKIANIFEILRRFCGSQMFSSNLIRFNSVDGAACEQFQADFSLTDAV
jgi:hypothetical protein